jgi:hypothetical protein
MSRRRANLIIARARAQRQVVEHILPVMRSQYQKLTRFLRRQNLRKRLQKIQVPDNIYAAGSGQAVAMYRTQELMKAPSPPQSQDDWAQWKRALLLALLLGLFDGVDDIGSVENEAWTSRGYDPLTFDGQQIVDDYQMRIGRNLSDLGDATAAGVNTIISDWYMGDEPFSALIERLDQLFNEARAQTIADTEVGNVTAQIFLQEMLSHGWSEWYWDAMGENPCQSPLTIKGMTYEGCLDLHGRVFKRGDPMPPDAAHPNCQCVPTPKIA